MRTLRHVLKVHKEKNPSLHSHLHEFQTIPQNRTSLLYQLVEAFTSFFLMLLPLQMTKTLHSLQQTCRNLQNLVANTKETQEIKSSLPLLFSCCFTVNRLSPVQSVIQVMTKAFIRLHLPYSPMLIMCSYGHYQLDNVLNVHLYFGIFTGWK